MAQEFWHKERQGRDADDVKKGTRQKMQAAGSRARASTSQDNTDLTAQSKPHTDQTDQRLKCT